MPACNSSGPSIKAILSLCDESFSDMSTDLGDRVPGAGCIGRRALSLGRGQLISLFITGTGVFASLLSSAKPDANFPNLLVLCNYVLLTGYLWRRLWQARTSRRRRHEPLATSSVSKALRADEELVREGEADDEEEEGQQQQQQKQQSTPVHFGWYILATILDMGGNWLFIKAYDFTTITSIMLLDCFTIPSAMLLSYLFLRISYKPIHVLGVVICICGLVCVVLGDLYLPTASSSSSSSSSSSTSKFAIRDEVLGDVMCILGSVLYAASNVLQEGLVKQGHREEYLGNLGLCGTLLSGALFIAFDLPRLRRTIVASTSVACMMGFVGCLFFMYTNTSLFLENSDAVVFNLSLLTSDIYAVVFSYMRTGTLAPWSYWIAFALVCTGLTVYYRTPPTPEGREGEGEGEGEGGQKQSLSISVSVSNPLVSS